MRDMVDKIILRCGSMSPTTAEEVRDRIREIVQAAYYEGWLDCNEVFDDGPTDGKVESWRKSVCRSAFLKTPEELEA
jgi:hypothetical protein